MPHYENYFDPILNNTMEFRQTKPMRNAFRLVATLFCIILLWSCSGGNSASDDSASASGTLTFNVVYHDGTGGNRQSKAASIDCAGQGVDTMEAKVYDSSDAFVAAGGPWDCDAGHGTITSVPSGSGLSVVLWGKDADGNNVFRGIKTGIIVIADSENDVGTIRLLCLRPDPVGSGRRINVRSRRHVFTVGSGCRGN